MPVDTMALASVTTSGRDSDIPSVPASSLVMITVLTPRFSRPRQTHQVGGGLPKPLLRDDGGVGAELLGGDAGRSS